MTDNAYKAVIREAFERVVSAACNDQLSLEEYITARRILDEPWLLWQAAWHAALASVKYEV